ncbi:TauD/TfdA family dioxygenase [Sciscionella sediminilitoris]|uniref:TauD/TfdA family dioxygenase n=1 Tax=Sciscionella sediminilitoris TaxID=1445613 RepID=UPI0004DF6426|nr:TauD/TfdA family dioxygenase [Sciscionella sp. SE31]
MSLSVNIEPAPAAVTLETGDREELSRLARELIANGDGRIDDPAWIRAAAHAWERLPHTVRATIREFRRDSGRRGALLLRDLPVPELPPTPNEPGSVQHEATESAAALLMFAAGLGDPAAFRPEKGGAMVQNVVPVPGKEEFQGNAGSVLLEFHNENAFHPHRPDFVMLLCLRADHEGIAGLRTACIREAFPLLSQESRAALFEPRFVTSAPPSFGAGRDATEPHAVLTGAPEDPDLRVDFAATEALTPTGTAALDELQQLFGRLAQNHLLRPGDLAIVDNRVTVHGRTAFTPRYDGADRWLQRTFALTDLRRSRELRALDGHVLS